MTSVFTKIMSMDRDSRLEEEKRKEAALEAAWKRLAETRPEFTCSENQDCLGLYSLLDRHLTGSDILKAFPDLCQLPYNRVQSIIDTVSLYCKTQGALLFATLTRPAHVGPETATQVPFAEFWNGWEMLHQEGSEESVAYLGAVGQLPLLQPLFIAIVGALCESFIEQFPELAGSEARFEQIVSGRLVDGLKLEFLCVRLIREHCEGDSMRKQLFSRLAGGEEITEEETLRRLAGGEIAPEDALPWPLDHRCRCSADLGPSIFCCNPKKPIDPAVFEPHLCETYLYKTDCCGAHFGGFRCDLCGQLYTWVKGVVRNVT